MPGMTWKSLLNSPQPSAAGVALANSTSLTAISVAPQYVLPANFAFPGSSLSFAAWGVLSTTTGPPSILIGVYWGGVAGVALATTGSVATTASVTNVPWRIELDTTIWTTGTGGTANSQGKFWLGTSVSAWTSLPMPNIAQATVSVDTTAAKELSVGAQWSAASASNTIQLRGFEIYSDGL
jgi:hypothetical protein